MLGVMTRNLGRLIWCKGRAILTNNNIPEAYSFATNRYIISSSDPYSSTSSFNSFKSAPFLHFSRCTHGENSKHIYHKVEEEAKGGSTSDMEIKKVNELTEGDTVNLCDLLFTKTRDYLIKCNGGEQVKAAQLAGKVVLIYFDSVSDMDTQCLKSLMYIYNNLKPNNGFEVVFVDADDSDAGEISFFSHEVEPDEQFENVFPTMPWTAIPLSDIASRKYLKQRFGVPEIIEIGNLFVIDPTGIILQCEARHIFCDYGAAGYPFTKERIDFLHSEDDAAVRQPSLKTLLASADRDYLISNRGEKVPIHTLEDKVVALFIYTECDSHQKFAAELKVAYEELQKTGKKFEVVLVYLYDTPSTYCITSEESFSNTFKTMPWLALPFRDSNYKKLERIFFIPWKYDMQDYGLIVIGPHMEFIQPFGLSILTVFKTPAYPFSREKVADLVTGEAKKMKLEMLWDPNSVFSGKYGAQVRLCQLVGKRVMILFNWYGLEECDVKLLQTLKEKYIQLKGTDDEFEVIHITMESSNNEHVESLPWFVQLVDDYGYARNFFGLYGSYESCCSLVAFDRDGRVVRKTIHPTFEDTDFPFYSGGLEKEALSQLDTVFAWNWLQESYPGTIYSYKQNFNRSI